jgi:hypothetical protein
MNAINRFFAGLRSKITGFFSGVLSFGRRLHSAAKAVPGFAACAVAATTVTAVGVVGVVTCVSLHAWLTAVIATACVSLPLCAWTEIAIRPSARTRQLIGDAAVMTSGTIAGFITLANCGAMFGGWGVLLSYPAFLLGQYVVGRTLIACGLWRYPVETDEELAARFEATFMADRAAAARAATNLA